MSERQSAHDSRKCTLSKQHTKLWRQPFPCNSGQTRYSTASRSCNIRCEKRAVRVSAQFQEKQRGSGCEGANRTGCAKFQSSGNQQGIRTTLGDRRIATSSHPYTGWLPLWTAQDGRGIRMSTGHPTTKSQAQGMGWSGITPTDTATHETSLTEWKQTPAVIREMTS